jgi:ribose transport system substrate-binding protein
MRLRFLTALALVLLVGAACTAGAEAPTQPTITEAPTGSPEPVATDASLAPSDTKLAVVTGGPHPYFTPWGDAAADAEADFGLVGSIFKFPPEWSFDQENGVIETLVAQGYNAFVVFPGDPTGQNATYEELASKGIPAVSAAGCTLEPVKDKLCFATDVKLSAYNGTKALIEAMGGEGNVVHLAGYLSDPNTTLRMDGVEEAVNETGGKVTLLQQLAETDEWEVGERLISSLLAARENEIDGLIATGYIQSALSAKHLTNIGDKRIKLVGIDDDQIVLDAIRDGFMVGTMSQNPYLQAYAGAYSLDLFRRGCTAKTDTPHLIDSGSGLITASDLDTYKDNLRSFAKEFVTTFKDTYMECAL